MLLAPNNLLLSLFHCIIVTWSGNYYKTGGIILPTVYNNKYQGQQGGISMYENKIATITQKRQVTIPKDFFEELDLKPGKINCYIEDGKIILEPLNSSNVWDFSTTILTELVNEGYEGDELLQEFENRKTMLKESMAAMVAEAREEIKEQKVKNAEQVFEEIFSVFE